MAIAAPAAAQPASPGGADRLAPLSGETPQADDRRAVVAHFDLDGDGTLSPTERAMARYFLAAQDEANQRRRAERAAATPPEAPPTASGDAATTTAGPTAELRPTETGTPGIALTPADVEDYSGAALYDPSIVRTIFVDFGFDDWEAELAVFFNTDVEIPASVTVDGETYPEVGIRFRGNTSFTMIPAGLKRPLRLKFDFVRDGQALEGFRTINLLNGAGDPTLLRLALYAHIAGQYIAAPRVNFVRLVVNGENWGIYASQQHFNRDFIAEHFGHDGDGVRWEVPGSPDARGGMDYLGDEIAPYRTHYEIDNRDNEESWRALINLFRVLNETPLDRLAEALDPILDVDGVLRFLALEIALNNNDGYYARASDYSIYLDPDGRFHIVPHDMNEGLFAWRGGSQLDPLVGLDDPTRPLRSRLLAVPEFRVRYLRYLEEIAATWLDWDRLIPMVRAYHSLIAPDMERDTRRLFGIDAFYDGIAGLVDFFTGRRDYLLAVVPPLIAAASGQDAAGDAAAGGR